MDGVNHRPPSQLDVHGARDRQQSFILFEGKEGEGEKFVHVQRESWECICVCVCVCMCDYKLQSTTVKKFICLLIIIIYYYYYYYNIIIIIGITNIPLNRKPVK